MQFTEKVPEDLGVSVRRMTLNLYFKVDNSIGIELQVLSFCHGPAPTSPAMVFSHET